jgi:hypothetical protein
MVQFGEMGGEDGRYPPDALLRPPQPRWARTVGNVSRFTFNMVLLGLILLILAIPISIGLKHLQQAQPPAPAQAAATVVPTPTLAPGYTGTANALYSVAYPSSWKVSPGGATLACGCSLTGQVFSGAGVTITIYAGPAVPADQLAQLQGIAAAAIEPNQTPAPLALNKSVTYDGSKWLENDYTVAAVQGNTSVQLEARVLAVDYGATTYLIVATAPRSQFSSANGQYIEAVLRSFRFQ